MKRLPLRSFRLQNFKAVRDSGTVEFTPLTVLIGNNGSGKSSLIEGLETFCSIVLDGLDAAMRPWRGFEYIRNRAVSHELRRLSNHRPRHTHQMIFQAHLANLNARAQQEINIGEGGNELFIQREQLLTKGPFGKRAQDAKTTRNAEGLQSIIVDSDRSKRVPEPPLADGQSAFAPLKPYLDQWQFLSLDPNLMGQPAPQQRASRRIRLAKSGANIAQYLQELRTLDSSAFEGLLEALRYVLPYAADLQTSLTTELERAFYLKMTEENFEVPGWLLSTGTLRIVALLACLRHPQPPPLLVVEEIENGLDPRTIHMLVEEMHNAVDSGRTQIVLTTHSPYLLDLLPLSSLILVERIEKQPVFTRPADDKVLAKWAKSFNSGQLYTMDRLKRRQGD